MQLSTRFCILWISFNLLAWVMIAQGQTDTAYRPLEAEPDFRNALVLQGIINAGTLTLAYDIEALSKIPEDVIKIVINSPGGDISVTYKIIAAMELAKARGKNIACLVPGEAKSAALYIFSFCDTRYALRYSSVLFHYIRMSKNYHNLTALEARYVASVLETLAEPLDRKLAEQLGVPLDELDMYYAAEVEWPMDIFIQRFPKFAVTVVNNFVLPNGMVAFPLPLPFRPPQ